MVKAIETTRARGRLYRRAHDRPHAAEAWTGDPDEGRPPAGPRRTRRRRPRPRRRPAHWPRRGRRGRAAGPGDTARHRPGPDHAGPRAGRARQRYDAHDRARHFGHGRPRARPRSGAGAAGRRPPRGGQGRRRSGRRRLRRHHLPARARPRAARRRAGCRQDPARARRGQALAIDTKRVQFTPDLMPGDITGSLVYDNTTSEFVFREGPVFTNLLLADEINRTPPKTQSSLLEAMEERQVSVDGAPRHCPGRSSWRRPRTRSSTRGPTRCPRHSSTGSCSRSSSRSCRREAELEILRRHASGFDPRDLDAAGLGGGRRRRPRGGSRPPCVRSPSPPRWRGTSSTSRGRPAAPSLSLGVSPRGATALLATSRAWAWMNGRTFVTPDDVKALAHATLSHRLSLRPEAELDGVARSGPLATPSARSRSPVPTS